MVVYLERKEKYMKGSLHCQIYMFFTQRFNTLLWGKMVGVAMSPCQLHTELCNYRPAHIYVWTTMLN